jgi:membrane-bound ClpP family serine protease
MNKRLTTYRLALAVFSTSLEETAIWAISRWVLPDFGLEMPFPLLIVIMAAWLAFSGWLFVFTTRTIKRQAHVGLPSMVGTSGRTVGQLAPEGMIKIRGELWGAVAEDGEKIEAGAEVIVAAQDGLKLTVRKTGSAAAKR